MELSPSAAPVRAPKKAAFASWIGSAVEYYDFFIYGTAAALVFGKIFFPSIDPKLATVAAFATFGVGYVTRPIGAFFMGHIGDKFGRKRVLMMTLLLMGASTFADRPPADVQPGRHRRADPARRAAPAPGSFRRRRAGRRELDDSRARARSPARLLHQLHAVGGRRWGSSWRRSSSCRSPRCSEQDLLSWGWRVPFFLSAIVVAVGFWVRRTLPETPAFTEEVAHHEAPKMPLAELFQKHTPDVLRVVFAALVSVVSTIFGVFVLSYAVNTMHLPRTQMLLLLVCTNIVALAAIPLWAMLSDRIGRRPVFLIGAIGSAIFIWPTLWAIAQADVMLIFVCGLLLSGVIYSAANGVWPSLYGEMFDTRVRLSGMAIGTQIGFALGGFAPSISAAILGPGPDGWMPVAALVSGACLIAAISVLSARETYNVPMHRLGKLRLA